ncbi:MAG TPA: nuclear transport factor 2 family protein [Paracoccaceae bacterium]|nr:nuclear transport factor 2 family protein [Paracoccaceae bacterium]HMO73375.1 nuclear transport factor 2 family protein [Paracoccaceae bacterium]
MPKALPGSPVSVLHLAAGLAALLAGALPVPAQGVANPRDAATVLTEAVAARNAAAIANLYAPESLVMNPGGPALQGRAAIGDAWARNLAGGLSQIEFGEVRTERGQDRAAVVWSWTVTIAPPGQPASQVRGRSLVYFTLTPQGWLISADMWHPAP